MAKRRLEFSTRARQDIEVIEDWYLDTVGDEVAFRAVEAVLDQAEKINALDLMFRPGIRAGTRECVMQSFPYILVYVIRRGVVRIVRVIHQRSEYFNRKKND